MIPLISCNNIAYKYGNKTVLSNISFEINKGDYLCILGENGSGKTTLINLLLGILKPLCGEIQFSKDITSKEIGYLPQQTEAHKGFPASVYEVVLSGCVNKLKWFPFYGKKERLIADENINLMEISELKHKCFNSLSGGQQQRVLLARALCATKGLLLLDEPTTGLDPLATESLYEIVKHLNVKHNITVIMVSHDIKSACKYSTNILHLDNKVLFYGKTCDYLKTDISRLLNGGEKVD